MGKEFIWCLHCERVSKDDDWFKNDEFCPYKDCDGGYFDKWSYDFVAEKNNYERVPKKGKKYKLYGDEVKI